MANLLTKSKYLIGIQCHKHLWISFNDKARLPPVAPSTQFVFDQGHEVGEYAKQLFPDGIDVAYCGFKESITETLKLLPKRKPLFEASILADGVYSRIDILNPVGEDLWDIIEVKSTTGIRDEHIWDVTFQKYCCEKSGLRVKDCYLAHLDNEYIRNGEIDLNELFSVVEVSEQVQSIYNKIPLQIMEMFKTVEANDCPDIPIGMHCLQPYECRLKHHCWAHLPENTIFNLYWMGKKKKFEMFEQGLTTIEEIPDYYQLTEKQRIQKQTITENEAYVDKDGIRSFLQTLKYPLYYLDFETFNPAIPLYNGSRPYQRIPFQYSLHIVDQQGWSAKHHSFLADGVGDPRPKFLKSLREMIGNSGSVVVYNQKFEEGVLSELAESFAEHEIWIKNVIHRMVDLLSPFQDFHYHHPDQNGSASLKKVLPVLTNQSYDGMNIQGGDEASRIFVKTFIKRQDVNNEQQIRQYLEDYCKLDTQAMIDVVEKLKEITK